MFARGPTGSPNNESGNGTPITCLPSNHGETLPYQILPNKSQVDPTTPYQTHPGQLNITNNAQPNPTTTRLTGLDLYE